MPYITIAIFFLLHTATKPSLNEIIMIIIMASMGPGRPFQVAMFYFVMLWHKWSWSTTLMTT